MLVEIKYYGPTNFKGSRLRAKCNQGKIFKSFDYGASDAQGAKNIALELFKKYNQESRYQVQSVEIVGYLDNKTFVKVKVKYL